LFQAAWSEPAADGSLTLREIVAPVRHFYASVHFWQRGLGARMREEGSGHAALRFISPAPTLAAEVRLTASDREPPEPALDAPGHPCVALVSNNVAADGERLMAEGASRRSGAFSLTIAGKPLRVEIFEGPSRELVELIELVRS
jgi:hypothetical protein